LSKKQTRSGGKLDDLNQQSTKKYSSIPLEVERIGKFCLNAAFKVHTTLGPGLLESVYEKALSYELLNQGLVVETQKIPPVIYDGNILDAGLRMDILVEHCVVLELKAVEKMIPLFEAQLLTYLKLSNIRLGYLINFNVIKLKDGIKRKVF
jgi:GxxExxY protein